MCRLRFPPLRSPSGDEWAHKLWGHHTWSCDLHMVMKATEESDLQNFPSLVGSTQKGLFVCAHEQPNFHPRRVCLGDLYSFGTSRPPPRHSCTITSHKLAFLRNLLQLHNPAAKENQHKLAHAVSWIIITNESHETFLCNTRILNLFLNCHTRSSWTECRPVQRGETIAKKA